MHFTEFAIFDSQISHLSKELEAEIGNYYTKVKETSLIEGYFFIRQINYFWQLCANTYL